MQLIINGVTLDGDLMDADFMEKFESSMIKMRDSALASKAVSYHSAAEAYRAQCNVVDTCFDDIFGPGTAAAIFKGKTNVREHLLAIEQVNEWAARRAQGAQRPHQQVHPATAGRSQQRTDRPVRLP